MVRKLLNRAPDTRFRTQTTEEILVRAKTSEMLQKLRRGVEIVIQPSSFKCDTGVHAVHVRERADRAGYFRKSLDVELHLAEVVPIMDFKEILMAPTLPFARHETEVEVGTVRLSEDLPFAASLLGAIHRLGHWQYAGLRRGRQKAGDVGIANGKKIEGGRAYDEEL
ncbi:hypothetical protein C8F01DRAFT_1174133, partial [Mycena amicta]